MKKLVSLLSLLAFMSAAVGTSLADSNRKTSPRAVTATAYSLATPKVVQFGGGTPDQANLAIAAGVAGAVLIGGAALVVGAAVGAVAAVAVTEVVHHHTSKEPAPKSLSLRFADDSADVLFDVAQ